MTTTITVEDKDDNGNVIGTHEEFVTDPPDQRASLIFGTADDDVITVPAGNDVVVGGAGNDLITAGGGINTIAGGPGNDTLRGGTGLDFYVCNQGDGIDTILDSGAIGRDGILFGPGIGSSDLNAILDQ